MRARRVRQPLPPPDIIMLEMTVEEAEKLAYLAARNLSIPEMLEKVEGDNSKKVEDFLSSIHAELFDLGIVTTRRRVFQ